MMLLSDWLQSWLESDVLNVRASTHEARAIYVKRHLIPGFRSDLRLDELNVQLCQAFAEGKIKQGLSLASVRKYISILRQSLDDAVRFGLLRDNPARYVKIPRERIRPERVVMLSASEARALLSCFRLTSIFSAVLLALYYGLRRSEVLGLKWSAIDFTRGTLTVRHTVTHVSQIHAEDLTKTLSSYRTFELLPEVAEVLAVLRGGSKDSDYVLHRADGSPFRPDSLTRTFSRTLARFGLPHMRFHDLRHSTASILFDRGWSLEDVREWLGHSDIETTANIYIHYKAQRKILIARDLTGVLLPTVPAAEDAGHVQRGSESTQKKPDG